MFCVKNLYVLGFDVFKAVHNGALKFLGVFFGNSLSSHQGVW